MLHPDLARALATAHIEDLHRAAARRQAIRSAEQHPNPGSQATRTNPGADKQPARDGSSARADRPREPDMDVGRPTPGASAAR